MKFYISGITDDKILVMARAESENGQTIGDIIRDIHPGEEFMGLSFDMLVELGLGEHELGPAMTPHPDNDTVVHLDNHDREVPKERAVRVRILTTDAQGNRLEIYGETRKPVK